ncbi:hypothetical protein ACX93W_16635 [Paenibacillus sp. CAU 1782]
MKKRFKIVVLMLTMLLTFSTVVSAIPIDVDPTEPGNNTPITTYQYSQNVYISWIQTPTDVDFWNFVSPKTGFQEIWLLPPAGTTYRFGVYEYGASSPMTWVVASGSTGPTSVFVPLVAGNKYTVLIMPYDGTFSDTNPYYIGHPYLFPF